MDQTGVLENSERLPWKQNVRACPVPARDNLSEIDLFNAACQRREGVERDSLGMDMRHPVFNMLLVLHLLGVSKGQVANRLTAHRKHYWVVPRATGICYGISLELLQVVAG